MSFENFRWKWLSSCFKNDFPLSLSLHIDRKICTSQIPIAWSAAITGFYSTKGTRGAVIPFEVGIAHAGAHPNTKINSGPVLLEMGIQSIPGGSLQFESQALSAQG